MTQDNTDGKRRATRKEIVELMKSLKIEQGGSDEWVVILGKTLREKYPGTYEGIRKLAQEDARGKQ